MAKGGFPRGMGAMGGGNMNQMLKQAKKMQEQMMKMQE
ncbi:MAG: YbaB/EbfC family nucleoid-associated protein, partial [bacterium]|nr:YbaB/EbfC family nucleoid-associated protein [bacterium]